MLLGEILVEGHGLAVADIERALQFQLQYGGQLGAILLNMGVLSEDALVDALASQLKLDRYQKIDKDLLDFACGISEKEINIPFLLGCKWLPLQVTDCGISFATVNPLDATVLQYLSDNSIDAKLFLVTDSEFRELENRYLLEVESGTTGILDFMDIQDTEIDKIRELASEAPIVNLVNNFLSQAVSRGASDLHLEPFKEMYRVRFRIDGILHDIEFLPFQLQLPVVSRIKVMAGMDIAEARKPQDGQINIKVAGKDVDIRVSTLPLAHSESLVLRLLVKESMTYELAALGFERDLVALIHEDLAKTSGVILLTGPTGSGKTTTLYSFLNILNTEERKIITVEDPVEYQLDGINQIQIHPEIGYDFVTSLRNILRQDPDVIMVGEIRDGETARMAMQSSLTGHIVFTTIHTNNAPAAYTRLIDLGVDEYLINSTIVSIIAQRLVRKVCSHCVERVPIDEATIKNYNLDGLADKYDLSCQQMMKAKGCAVCGKTGYRGRVGIMEYLRVTASLRALPKGESFHENATAYMLENNIRSLMDDGLLKVLRGETTLDEVLRVCS